MIFLVAIKRLMSSFKADVPSCIKHENYSAPDHSAALEEQSSGHCPSSPPRVLIAAFLVVACHLFNKVCKF